MTKKIIRKRIPFFIPVEGDGEQSLIRWIQMLADQNELHVHLDCEVLGGGGYEKMLTRAIRLRERKERKKAKNSILLVDGDRAKRGDDDWTVERLRREAAGENFITCIQNPNLEGLLLRLMAGKERLQPHASTVHRQLVSVWPDYEKPADARTLSGRFSIKDLFRVARLDKELDGLLRIVGLIRGK